MKSCGSSRVWTWKSAFRSTLPPTQRIPSLAHILQGPDSLLHRDPERGPAEAEGQEAAEDRPGLVERGNGVLPEAVPEVERRRPREERDHGQDVEHGQDHEGDPAVGAS